MFWELIKSETKLNKRTCWTILLSKSSLSLALMKCNGYVASCGASVSMHGILEIFRRLLPNF